MQRKLGGPHRPVGMPGRPRDGIALRGLLIGGTDRIDGATARRLLEALLQGQPGGCEGQDFILESIILPGVSAIQIDDLICLSAEMRGMIFQAYARRIVELLTSGGKLVEGGTPDYRLN